MATHILRRDFDLPEEDEEHLNARGLSWETLADGTYRWLLVHDFPIPAGYSAPTANIAVQIPPSYPTAELDMVYFCPSLTRSDGAYIPNTEAVMTIKGLSYQRWSRHRTPQNPWRPEIDNMSTHLGLAEEWLSREFVMRPRRG